MADTANLRVRVSSSGVDTTESSLNQLATTSERAERTVERLQGGLAAIGVGVSLAATVQQFTTAVQVTADFNQSISNLSAITGAVGADLDFLTQSALDFGSTTTLSASQVADAFRLVASARADLLDNIPALQAVTREAITLAEAAGVTVPEAAQALTTSLTQFQIPAENAARVINVLAASAREGSSEIADTSMALADAGLIANQAGISFEEANGAVQALALGTIRGAEAGTALRNIFTILESQSSRNLRPSVVGLTQALINLEEEGYLNTAQAVTLFGRENITAAQTLIQFRDEVERVTAAVTGTDEAYRQAATNVDNLAGDLLGLQSAFEAVQITTGTYVDGPLRALTQELTLLLQAVAGNEEALNEYGSAIEVTTDVAAVLAVALGARLTTALVTSARGYVSNAIAANRASVVTNIYGQVLSRTTVAANVANVAVGALSRTMGLLGGPIGLIATVAASLVIFNTNASDSSSTAITLTEELNNLAQGYTNLSEAQRDSRVAELTLELEDLVGVQSSLQTQLDALNNLGAQQGITSGQAAGEVARAEGQLRNELTQTTQEIEARRNAIERLNAISFETPDSVTPDGGEIVTADLATQNLIESLENQIAVANLAGEEAAQLRAEQRAGAEATAAQIAQVRTLAAELFQLQEAQRQEAEATRDAARAADEKRREQERLRDVEDRVLEGITGVTSATIEQRDALVRLAEQGRITGDQLSNSLLRLGGEEGQLNFAQGFQNQLNIMEESTSNTAQILGEQFGAIFGPGGTLQQGIADSAAQAIVFGEDFNSLLANVGQTIATQLLSQLIQIGIQQATNAVIAQTAASTSIAATTAAATASQTAITAGGVTAAASLATAWAPAAAAASLATLGTNSAPAIAAITATNAAAQAASASGGFAGFFANGGNIPAGQFGIAQEAGFEFVNGPANITSARRSTEAINNLANQSSSPNINFEVINQVPNAEISQPQIMSDGTVRMIVREMVPTIMEQEASNERSRFNKASDRIFRRERR